MNFRQMTSLLLSFSLLVGPLANARPLVGVCPELPPKATAKAETVTAEKDKEEKKSPQVYPYDRNLERVILEDLHLELYTQLHNAQGYLRSLINCFQENPLTQEAKSEPMYTDYMSCADIRGRLHADLKVAWTNMRVYLAMSSAEFQESPVHVERRPTTKTMITAKIVHTYDNLAPLPPLTPAEIAAAKSLWDHDTEVFDKSYRTRSCLEKTLESSPPSSEGALNALEQLDDEERLRFRARRRMSARQAYLNAYHEILGASPLVGYLSHPLGDQLQPADRAEILAGLYKLLSNNCVVQVSKYSDPPIRWRKVAEWQCAKRMEEMARVASRPLVEQDALQLQYDSKLNWRAPFKAVDVPYYEMGSTQALGLEVPFEQERRSELLDPFGYHPEIIKVFRTSYADDPRAVAMIDSLRTEHGHSQLMGAVAEAGFYLGLGFLCTFGLRRFPGLTTFVRRFGMPICLFGTGLPLSALGWFQGHEEYWKTYTEVFSSAPNRQALRELKDLQSAELAQTLNFIFLAVGTGLPEIGRAAKPWARLLRMKWRKAH